jgi:hypothetical protein
MRPVRITCLPINATGQRPITIDAVIDQEDRISGSHPLFGLWGRIDQDSDGYCPLVLRSDGIIDFGDSFDAVADRYFAFDLRDGKIAVNRVLTYKSRDRSIVVGYLIDDVAVLASA